MLKEMKKMVEVVKNVKDFKKYVEIVKKNMVEFIGENFIILKNRIWD